jgi:ribosomal protein L19E
MAQNLSKIAGSAKVAAAGVVGCCVMVVWLNGESVSGIGLALVVADIVALIWLLTNRRLRACFNEEKE